MHMALEGEFSFWVVVGLFLTKERFDDGVDV